MKLFTTLNSKKIIVTHRYTIVTYSYNKKYELKFLVISYVHLRKKSNVKRFLRKISEKNLHERFCQEFFRAAQNLYFWRWCPKAYLTTWKVSLYGVFLVRISHIRTKYGEMWSISIVFSPELGKYEPEKIRLPTLFTQCLVPCQIFMMKYFGNNN